VNFPYASTRFIWKVADWVFPPVCAGCGAVNYRFCPLCLNNVKLLHDTFCLSCGGPTQTSKKLCPKCLELHIYCTDIYSWAEYEGSLRKAIHNLKYKQDIGLGDFFAPYLISIIEKKRCLIDLVIPVPISKTRLKTRGFNQSTLLSTPIARYFSLEHSRNSLIRVKETESQTHLSAEDRLINMEDAFYGNPAKLKGRKVLLVDDIVTTGATMNSCAKAMLEAGAEQIYGISIAKTILVNNKLRNSGI
jgi:ComF family protein